MNLRSLLEEYRDLTIEIINKVKEDNELEALIKKRGDIIEQIKKNDFSKDEIKVIVEEFNIMALEKKVKEILLKEKQSIKEEMVSLRKNRNAQKGYTSFKSYPYFFNREG